MNHSQISYFCPNDDASQSLKERTHECYLHQNYIKLYGGELIDTWTKCNTCGYEHIQVMLTLIEGVEVIRHKASQNPAL